MGVKNNFLLLLIVIIFFSNIVKCVVEYTIQDVTTYDGKNVYATNNLYCFLNLVIVVNVLTPDVSLLSINISSTPATNIPIEQYITSTAYLQFKQDNYYFYNLVFYPSIGETTTSLNLFFDNSDVSAFNFLNYTCQGIPQKWNIERLETSYQQFGIGLLSYYRVKFNITNYGDKISYSLINVDCSNTVGIFCTSNGIYSFDSSFSLFDVFFQFNKDFKGITNDLLITLGGGKGNTTVSVPLPTRNYYSDSVSFNVSNFFGYFSKYYFFSVYKSVLYDKSKEFDLFDLVDDSLRTLSPCEGVPGNATYIGGGGSQPPLEDNSTKYGLYSIDSSGVHNSFLTSSSSINVGYINNTNPGPEISIVDNISFSIDPLKPSAEITARSNLLNLNIGLQSGSVYSVLYPFGITGRFNVSVFNKRVTILTSNYVKSKIYIDGQTSNTEYTPYNYNTDSILPRVVSFSVSSYNGLSVVGRIHIVDKGQSGFYSFQTNSASVGIGNLVSGDLNDGIYEISTDFGFSYINQALLQDFYGTMYDNALNIINFSNVYKIEPSTSKISYFLNPLSSFSFSKYNITQFYFSIPYGESIDTTNKLATASLYFNTTHHDEQLNVIPYILFGNNYISGRQRILTLADKNLLFPGYWNKTISMYQIDFRLQMNQFTTTSLYYTLVWGNSLIPCPSLIQIFPTAALSVYSNYGDTMGPLITDLVKIQGNQVVTVDNGTGNKIVGWNFKIQDFNGFQNGTITVKSKELQIDRIFKITNLDGPNYKIEIEITPKCISQTLYLSSITLVDKGGYTSSTDQLLRSTYFYRVNPLTYINGTDLLEITLNCPLGVDYDFANNAGPQLMNFNVFPKSLDVGLENRLVKFTFTIQNIDKSILPTLYLGTINFKYKPITDCKIINSTNDGTGNSITNYEATVKIDYGFGYIGGSIMLSIYGLYDSWGNMNGYSTGMLQGKNFDSIISIPTFTLNSPIINSVSSVNTWGGIITVFGNGFGVGGNDSVVQVDYLDGLGFTSLIHQFNSGVYKVVKIRPTNYSFNIRVINTASGLISSILTVYPINSVERPPTTPPPTNSPPQKCPGTPQECTGSSNGYCNTATSTCVCYPPWSGLDCNSRIITIPPQPIDETKPIINITLGSSNAQVGNNSNIEGEDELLTSLINVVSLREFDVNNKLINQYNFDQWLFKNVTSTTTTNSNLEYLYTNVIKVDDEGGDYNCTVNVLVQWFKEESKYSFANSNFTIPASSIKYNINITHYPFKSNLNTLQLVMAVSIQSSKTVDTCSSKDFGVADEINQYLKLSVNKKSIYGIFINRGIIDSRVVAISNTILDSLSNETTSLQNDAHTSSSYVGVNIPNFYGLACLDPSFNVLLDNNIDNNENSICSNNSKSGLTSAQIAGIVVGSVVALSILIAIVIVIAKSTKGRIALKAIKLKSYK